MRSIWLVPGLVLLVGCAAYRRDATEAIAGDWLVHAWDKPAEVREEPGDRSLVLTNGLISRVIRLSPNAATVAFDNLMTGESLLRAVKPEAQVTIDGRSYAVGGLRGQPDAAYLDPDWLEGLVDEPGAFRFRDFTVGRIRARLDWKRTRYAEERPWPPSGASLTLRFSAPPSGPRGIEVSVHYQIYQGLPLLGKWLTVSNGSPIAPSP